MSDAKDLKPQYERPIHPCDGCGGPIKGPILDWIKCDKCSNGLQWCKTCNQRPDASTLRTQLARWIRPNQALLPRSHFGYGSDSQNGIKMTEWMQRVPDNHRFKAPMMPPVVVYCSHECAQICRFCKTCICFSCAYSQDVTIRRGLCHACRLELEPTTCDRCEQKTLSIAELKECKVCDLQMCSNCITSDQKCSVCDGPPKCDECSTPAKYEYPFLCTNYRRRCHTNPCETSCSQMDSSRLACERHFQRSDSACPNCLPSSQRSPMRDRVCSDHRLHCDACHVMVGCARCIPPRPNLFVHCSACRDRIESALAPCYPRDLQRLLYTTLFVLVKASS